MRARFLIPGFLAAVTGLAMAAIAPTAPAADLKIGQPAPPFTLDDQNGKTVSLAQFGGKIVVLAWFNRDCPFVQRHLKANTFNTLAAKYKDKDVVLLAIDSSHTHTTAGNLQTVQEFNLSFPILNDASGMIGHTYNAKTTPEMFIINKDGSLVYQGAIDNDASNDSQSKVNYVSKALDELLAGKPISTAETKSYGCTVKYAE